ncbi:MAG: DUF222 domain-containing protein, partial [Acidimicrobiales bacterium]
MLVANRPTSPDHTARSDRADASERTSGETPARSIGERLISAGHALGRAQQEIVALAAEFEAGNEWIQGGSPTAAHWIADRLDVRVSTAREWIRTGRALSGLPVIASAFEAQQLSYSKVRSLTRVATPDSEAELCELARQVPAGRLCVELAAWSQANEDPIEREDRHHRQRRLVWQTEPDGMVSGWFRLAPEAAARMIAAICATVR